MSSPAAVPQHRPDPAGPPEATADDLAAVTDVATLARELHRAKVTAGNPSFAQLAKRCGLPRSTIADAFSPQRAHPPALTVLRHTLLALGVDPTRLACWEAAWRRASTPEQPTEAVEQHRVVPRQLPADVPGFVGRADALAALDAVSVAPDTARLALVCGMGGVGKTGLVGHWAHRAASRFPGGQLWINLHGFDGSDPVTPAAALGQLLRGLLPVDAPIPGGEPERAALLRSLLADRQILLVLDNAHSADCVRVLLPGDAACMTVVTSRNALAGLVARDGARRTVLRPLSAGEATALLTGALGEPPAAQRPALTRLAARCGRLPLAMRVAAEVVSAQPDLPLTELIRDLESHGALAYLDATADADTSLRAVFAASCARLPADARHAFRVLGGYPGRDLDLHAMAALTDGPPTRARQLLNVLARSHLLEPTGQNRYAMHDLTRAYAGELADDQTGERPVDRDAALHRLLDHYLVAAAQARRSAFPDDSREVGVPAAPAAPRFATAAQALGWYDTELPNICAALHRPGASTPQVLALATLLDQYLSRQGHWAEALDVHRLAHARAEAAGDPLGAARAEARIGRTLCQLGHYDEAYRQLTRAREVLPEAERAVEAATSTLGIAAGKLGSFDEAAELHRQQIDEHTRCFGLTPPLGRHWANLSFALARLGELDQAEAALHQALTVSRGTHDRRDECSVYENLAVVHLRRQDFAGAVRWAERAVRMFESLPGYLDLITALNTYGVALAGVGRRDEALASHTRALRLCERIGDRFEAQRAQDAIRALHASSASPPAGPDAD
ncbi:ATP-binding protein [Actinocatenispora sera]|uniref:NTPase n=1 Tax=Actinocatenispora sera TaxID=390989 RepID=A0A810L5V4_9ACTN|nr:tetratricopeptide repeat protein [Actinocatenispora sera]BCJ30002.1 NTPase [Actinocatenispora sera]